MFMFIIVAIVAYVVYRIFLDSAGARGNGAPEFDAPDFDWRLGLALAGCAFEAYNGLDAGNINLRQTSLGSTEVSYVDKDFLNSCMDGILEVTVESASNLIKSDWGPGESGKSDPYCQITVGGSSARTKTIKNNHEPRWNETFFLFVRDLPTQNMLVRVFDEDTMDSDDLLGAVAVPLADLQDGSGIKEVVVPLVTYGQGSVSLKMRFLPFDEATGVADVTASAHMGGPVLGSPAVEFSKSPWTPVKALLIPAEAAADAAFTPVCYVNNVVSHTQAWVFWNPENRKLVLSFRGTEKTVLIDVLTNLNLIPTPLNGRIFTDTDQALLLIPAKGIDVVIKAVSYRLCKWLNNTRMLIDAGFRFASHTKGREERVHSGFLKAYKSVRPDVIQLVDAVLTAQEDPSSWTVYITGHSLGGALSTLCSYDLGTRPASEWPKGAKPTLINYSYGSPRVGNYVFAEAYNHAVPNSWRVVNNSDVVTTVPRLLGYTHIGHKCNILPDGTVEVDHHSSHSATEGITASDMATALLRAAIRNEKEDAANTVEIDSFEELQALIAKQKADMSGIMDGTAVLDHMEPQYLSSLQVTIKNHFHKQAAQRAAMAKN